MITNQPRTLTQFHAKKHINYYKHFFSGYTGNVASAPNPKLPRADLLGFSEYNLEKLKNMTPEQIKECKEILSFFRNPRLKKFAYSHVACYSTEEYSKAVKDASLSKLPECQKLSAS